MFERIWLAAALAVVLTATWGAAPAAQTGTPVAALPQQTLPLKIVALGDSLTSGHRLPTSQAFPALLERALLDASLPFAVINHGVSGDTSAGGLSRLEAALAERPQILIVELGVNDGLRGVPVGQIRKNLQQIIETAQGRGITVLLCAMDALPTHGWQYTLDFHRLYLDLAEHYKVTLVPFLLLDVLGNRELMSSDGVHPNADGARVIAEKVLTYLQPIAERVAAGASAPSPAAATR